MLLPLLLLLLLSGGAAGDCLPDPLPARRGLTKVPRAPGILRPTEWAAM